MELVLFYVDGLSIAGYMKSLDMKVKNASYLRCKMEGCGEAKQCLGIKISENYSSRTLKFFQDINEQKTLFWFGAADISSAPAPMVHEID